ncbi:MAG: hypothetical protein GY798_18035 [Hyphomicrobiales bacterium]|nr:hypothetical protein [Hyphomicrobiales bacterium]
MKMYVFKSQAKNGLRAFAADDEGGDLPERFGPWQADGNIAAEQALPYDLPRGEVEAALRNQGFQMWRLKADSPASSAKS